MNAFDLPATTAAVSSATFAATPAALAAHWMPFTGNRELKASGAGHGQRLWVRAQGAHYTDANGRRVFDGLSGLWCCGLGHARAEITEAALKLARAYWRCQGQAGKTLLVGREKGYHGVNVGGISVGGIAGNRKLYRQGVHADPIAHTQPANGAFHRGQPASGAELADDLLRVINLHDASNIAAVIVEPFAGSADVSIPPLGYLQRLREICSRHNILLIFDEVITGFGRCGAYTGAAAFGVTPDIANFAKQITNGAQPLGAVMTSKAIYDTFMAAGGNKSTVSSTRSATPCAKRREPPNRSLQSRHHPRFTHHVVRRSPPHA